VSCLHNQFDRQEEKRHFTGMSTLTEIKSAIAHLDPHDRAILTAELFAMESEPEPAELQASLRRGLDDVSAGRVRSIEDVRAMIPQWISRS